MKDYHGYKVSKNGEIIGKYGRPMIVRLNKGYHNISMWINGKKKMEKVHRLVAILYIPNPDNKPFVNHINGIKTDNRLDNLEWVTHSENTKHAIDNGFLKVFGEDNPMCKLSQSVVDEIRNLYKTGNFTQRQLGEIYGVGQVNIGRVINYKLWNK
jgi:predicted XRE-type DNA-binding protein